MRRKKGAGPLFIAARNYLRLHVPELDAAPIELRMLDGPPGAPSCAVMAETCLAKACPYGQTTQAAESGQCTMRDCPLRCSVRLLLDRRGEVMQATRSGVHWS
jgi:hypothetical protein